MATILICDDDPYWVTALGTTLEDFGHTVFGVPDQEQLYEVITRQKPDVIFLDVIIPGGGAISQLSKVRRAARRAKIVVCTGHRYVFTSPVMINGLEDADAKIMKTISHNELRELIDDLLKEGG